MAAPADPRPTPRALPEEVPVTLVDDRSLPALAAALSDSVATAIDTETVYDPDAPDTGPGPVRAVSLATRGPDGVEAAWVVDIDHIDIVELGCALSGTRAAAWNANFDALVLDRDVLDVARRDGRRVEEIVWWDAQLADALLHQGLSGFGFYHGLAWATEWYLGIHAQGKGTTQVSFRRGRELTPEQIAYAAADAVETLWVADVLRSRVTSAGLDVVCRLEQEARPFLDIMHRVGIPFDWEGWRSELDTVQDRLAEVLDALAASTGGGQGTLFTTRLEPSWNPSSERQAKEAVNRHHPDRVEAYFERSEGARRHLRAGDPLTSQVLGDIGGPLCDLLLEHRDLTKTITTYGAGVGDLIGEDGRLHPEYLQVVGTNTGRLASRRPNAQNFTPRMNTYLRPADPSRVFVHADLSQAELRFVAQVAGDHALQAAFSEGSDVHQSTAERMFGVDMAALAQTDPLRHRELRATAKRINFGIVYGQRGGGLARSLSQSGVPTTAEEGQRLLDAYLAAYPQVARWVAGRDAEIDALSASLPDMDWALTLDLHRLWPLTQQVRQEFRAAHRRWPSAEETHQALQGACSLDEVAWTMSFTAPIALRNDGAPFCILSRTPAGRRQQFTVHTDSLLATAATIILRSTKPGPTAVRKRLDERLGLRLDDHSQPLPDPDIDKLLEDRSLRRTIVEEVRSTMGDDDTDLLLSRALADRVRRLGNAYRNAPIQGGVADVMLHAYGLLHQRLTAHHLAVGVQTVHDSVVVECDRDEADDVARTVQACLEEAMAVWCPDVVPRADTDIRTSLADDDIVRALDQQIAAETSS